MKRHTWRLVAILPSFSLLLIILCDKKPWTSPMSKTQIASREFRTRPSSGSGFESESGDFSKFCHRLWKNNPTPVDEDKIGNVIETCSCENNPTTLGWFNESGLKRRNTEFMEWKRQQEIIQEPLIYSHAVSPFTFVAGGLTVRPGKSVAIKPIHIDPIAVQCLALIKEISFQNNVIEASFTCDKEKGVLFVPQMSAKSTGFAIKGNYTNSLAISIAVNKDTLESHMKVDVIATTINNALKSIHYYNHHYDIFTRDVIKVEFLGYTFEINVLIKERNLPRLYDTGPNNDISQKVTIVTKTFERPSAVIRLVKSIRKYYPSVTVIIADDSKTPLSFDDDNVKYYPMPFAEGWFAGRNLVISQVRTKYFLWVDDDFVFTELTDLRKGIEKLEDVDENLDVVAGVLGKLNQSPSPRTHKVLEFGNDDKMGACLYRKVGVHRKLRNYPACHLTSIVTNFFMAKTLSVRSIGFDPEFERIGHSEFFLDGFGYLRVASCSDFAINHKKVRTDVYTKYRTRQADPLDKDRNVQHVLFKNYFKCLEFH